MEFNRIGAREALATDLTLVWLFACVTPNVPSEMFGSIKAHATVWEGAMVILLHHGFFGQIFILERPGAKDIIDSGTWAGPAFRASI
jgi:trehalose utilization protein